VGTYIVEAKGATAWHIFMFSQGVQRVAETGYMEAILDDKYFANKAEFGCALA